MEGLPRYRPVYSTSVLDIAIVVGPRLVSETGVGTTSYTYSTIGTERLWYTSGGTSETFSYDALGRLKRDGMGTSGTLPIERFTGQERDQEGVLDYFEARMHQPRTGRFTAPDAEISTELDYIPDECRSTRRVIETPSPEITTCIFRPGAYDPSTAGGWPFLAISSFRLDSTEKA